MTLSPPYDPIVHLNVTRSGLGRHGHEQGHSGQFENLERRPSPSKVRNSMSIQIWGNGSPFFLRYFMLDPIILNLK